MTLKRIVGPAQLSASAATLYTAPAGVRAVIKRIHIVNTDAAPHTPTLSIGADAAGTRLYSVSPTIAASGGYFDDYANYPVEPGEVLQGFADLASKLTIIVTADLIAV